MEEEEIIITGIQHALRRGETLERAMQSFLNAGYPSALVRSAARKAQASMQQVRLRPRPVAAAPARRVKPVQTPRTARAAPVTATEYQPQQPPVQPRPVRQPAQKPMQQQQPEQQQYQPIEPIRRRPRSSATTWITVIAIAIVTLLVNGFLLWKYILS